MKKTYLLGSLILCILAVAVLTIVLSVTGIMGSDAKISLVFSTESQSKTYDGEPLVNSNWKLVSGELKKGHTITATVNGSQTNAGFSNNTMSVKIIDENQADVTEDYRIEYQLGKLTVLQRDIKVASDSASKQYDGEPLTCKSYKIISGRLLTGHRLKVEFSMSRTDVGVTENIMDIRILDKTDADVTANYKVEALSGSLHISGYPLTIKTASDEKVYDGTPLENSKYDVLVGELKDGHVMTVTVTGSQTTAGVGKNDFVVEIYDTIKKQDATKYYDINAIVGELTVNKRDITVSTHGITVTYAEAFKNGGVYTYDKYTVSNGLAPNQNIEVTVTGQVVGVGKAENTCVIDIFDKDGETAIQNYNVTKELGELEILPVDIAITSLDAYISYEEFVLSGKEPLRCEDYIISVGTLLDGHDVRLKFTGAQRTPGVGWNYFDVTVVDTKNGEANVTGLYKIERRYGYLEIGKINLTLGSTGAVKEYDGTPLTANGEGDWWIVGGELYEGHEIVRATMSSSITDVGREKNRVALTIFDKEGIDVTGCYNFIESELGYLEITPLSLFITAEGYSDMYNGQMVQPGIYHITGGYEELLARDHEIVVDFTQFPTEVGTYKNELAIIIYNSEGVEITHNYAIKRTEYDIVITPRVVTVRTDSDYKLYDGTPLTAPGWKVVSETQPLEGHELVVVVSGERTEIGSSPNEIAELRVVEIKIDPETGEETERDVSLNYNLAGAQLGVLTVKDPSAQGPGIEDPVLPPIDSEDVLLAKIRSTSNGAVYLREMSFGDYNGQGFDLAKSYPVCIDGTYSMSYLTALALESTSYVSQKMDIEYYTERYFLPYYLDVEEAGYTTQMSDVFYTDPGCTDASLYYYTYWYSSDETLPLVPNEYKEEEEAYRKYVYNTYLNMEGFSKTKAYMLNVIREQKLNKNDPKILEKVANFIQNCATYNLGYDRYLDFEDDVVVAFMEEYKEGVCRHYAMAATLLLRTLGIPARYTVGIYVDIEEENEWVEVNSNKGHAWTEVYIDGVGWIALEVTGGNGGVAPGPGPGLGAMKIDVTPSVDPMKYYDGAVLTATVENTKLYGNDTYSKMIQAGYTVMFEVEGSIAEVGYGEVKITSFRMFDPGGNELDLTDTTKYKVTLNTGRLHMYEFDIEVQSFDANSVYTGDYIKNERSWHSPLASGDHILEVTFGEGRCDAGSSTNYFTCKVYEYIGDEKVDISYRYYVTKKFGTITVTPREIVVQAESLTMSYDDFIVFVEQYGGSYALSQYTIVEGELCEGHTAKVTYTDEKELNITGAVRFQSTIDVIEILDGDGMFVDGGNYSIKYKKGTVNIK